MNKTAIKNFAVWARNKLIVDISYRAGLMGITESGIASALPQSTGTTEFYDIGTAEPYAISGDAVRQRKRLVELIERKAKETDYKTAYKYIIEEVAYTWFNRLIAIRFMEVNDYLPSHIRVLSSESGKMEPDLVTTPFDSDLSFTSEEEQMILQMKQENEIDELFKILFIKQCNALNEILPALFEKTKDYSEILLNLSVVDQEGIIYHLVNDIPEEDFNINQGGQVEIIGWLYQYYNVDTFNSIYDGDMSRKKIEKELIPAATQMFTPDWVVRYMVENSLGHFWLEGHPDEELKSKWLYYLESEEQNENVQVALDKIRLEYKDKDIKELRCIDPCMGSGHILVYAFDVLMDIYESVGYSQRDAASNIVEKNLWGLDIDKRATQLAYFAIMMKARQYDRRFFSRGIQPHVYTILESNDIDKSCIDYFANGNTGLQKELNCMIKELTDAKEYGSIVKVSSFNYETLFNRFEEMEKDMNIFSIAAVNELWPVIQVANTMAQKYEVCFTNPPYLNSSRMSSKMNNYVKKHYSGSRSDLAMVMFEAIINNFSKKNGMISLVTTTSWMFISSFEEVRNYVVHNMDFQSIVDFGTELFEGKIGHLPIVAWTNVNNHYGRKFKAVRLEEYCYAKRDLKQQEFFNSQNYYCSDENWFEVIDGNPLCYWINQAQIDAFRSNPAFVTISPPRTGMMTTNNKLFLRGWYEVDINNISFDSDSIQSSIESHKRWFPYNKGGDFQKWYGNRILVVNWEDAGRDIAASGMTSFRGKDFYFKEGLTWTIFGYDNFAVRYSPIGSIFDIGGTSTFPPKHLLYYILGFLNSRVASDFITLVNPTVNIQNGDIKRLPLIIDNDAVIKVTEMVKENIELVKRNYDSFETSWDFASSPLLIGREKGLIEIAVDEYIDMNRTAFMQLKDNEESINRLFAKLYHLEETTTIEISDKKVSICIETPSELIKKMLSYAVGCMFGRYSLDCEGVVYAGGTWDDNKFILFKPDKDSIM